MTENFPQKVNININEQQEDNNENLDWERIELMKAELKSIFESMERNLNAIKGMTEIAKDRNFIISDTAKEKVEQTLKKFEPYGQHMSPLYGMIGDLADIKSLFFTEGLLITADELTAKLEEIKKREAGK